MQKNTIPFWIGELIHALDGDIRQAAILMEVDPSTIRRAIAENLTTDRQELKAQNALSSLHAEREKQAARNAAPSHFLVSIPPDKTEAFQKVVVLMALEATAL